LYQKEHEQTVRSKEGLSTSASSSWCIEEAITITKALKAEGPLKRATSTGNRYSKTVIKQSALTILNRLQAELISQIAAIKVKEIEGIRQINVQATVHNGNEEAEAVLNSAKKLHVAPIHAGPGSLHLGQHHEHALNGNNIL